MNSLTDCYKLSNGVEIPCIGFGTWQTPDGDVAVASVKEAVRVGYRHIDTAAVYGNEEGVGRGIAECGVDRKELFVTTKLANSVRGYEETKTAVAESLERLGLDYIDLYLIHWPNPKRFRDNWQQNNANTWRAMEELYEKGTLRAIGISNFLPHHIDALMQSAKITPQVNQIRLCPGETQDDVVTASRALGMQMEAYSPFGMGAIFKTPVMQNFAEKYGKTIAQICVRWSLHKGFLPLPKSVTAERIAENTKVFDFELDADDIDAIGKIGEIGNHLPHPDETSF